MTDRQLLEIIIANQVQIFKQLDVIESFVHGVAEKAETFPKDSIPVHTERIDDSIEKMLRSANTTLTVLNKKL